MQRLRSSAAGGAQEEMRKLAAMAIAELEGQLQEKDRIIAELRKAKTG